MLPIHWLELVRLIGSTQNEVDLEVQSNNVFGTRKAGTIWQMVLVTTADHAHARRPEIMHMTFAEHTSELIPRRTLLLTLVFFFLLYSRCFLFFII